MPLITRICWSVFHKVDTIFCLKPSLSFEYEGWLCVSVVDRTNLSVGVLHLRLPFMTRLKRSVLRWINSVKLRIRLISSAVDNWSETEAKGNSEIAYSDVSFGSSGYLCYCISCFIIARIAFTSILYPQHIYIFHFKKIYVNYQSSKTIQYYCFRESRFLYGEYGKTSYWINHWQNANVKVIAEVPSTCCTHILRKQTDFPAVALRRRKTTSLTSQALFQQWPIRNHERMERRWLL